LAKLILQGAKGRDVFRREVTYYHTGFLAADMAGVHHLDEHWVRRLSWDSDAGYLLPIFLRQMVIAHRTILAEVVPGLCRRIVLMI
jgi:hypothetical protein